MATKREKRIAGEARSERQLAETIESGLKAQHNDRVRQARIKKIREDKKNLEHEAYLKDRKTLRDNKDRIVEGLAGIGPSSFMKLTIAFDNLAATEAKAAGNMTDLHAENTVDITRVSDCEPVE